MLLAWGGGGYLVRGLWKGVGSGLEKRERGRERRNQWLEKQSCQTAGREITRRGRWKKRGGIEVYEVVAEAD